jgi:uncharacterized protein involved in outer membrane biogenesis
LCGVKKVAKAILITLAVVVVAAVLGLIGINLYVQSPGARTRIQNELSRAMNTPLRITNTSLSPWGGLRINGITVPGETGTLLDAASFRANYRFLPLFRRELSIREMVIDRPKIVWAQNAEGRWIWPQLPKREDVEVKPETETEQPGDKKQDRFRMKVGGFRITNGSIELLDREQKRLALLTDINLAYKDAGKDEIKGDATIARAAWGEREGESIALTNLRTPFTYHDGELNLPELQADLAAGEVQGSVKVRPKERKSPFELNVKFERVDVATMAAEAGWAPGSASGTLGGSLAAKGSGREIERLKGEGHIELVRGQFRQLDFFRTIGQALGIPELADLRLKQGRADFRLADEKTHVENLLLEAPDLQLSAKGVARFDGKLALDARLAVSDRIRLPGFVKDSFTATDTPGQLAIDFKIAGRTDRPRTDLAEKLVGKKLGDQFESLVSNLFGLGRKKDGEPKKEKEKKKKDKDKSAEKQAAAVRETDATAPAAEAPVPPVGQP